MGRRARRARLGEQQDGPLGRGHRAAGAPRHRRARPGHRRAARRGARGRRQDSWSPRAAAAARGTPSSRRPRISRRASGSRARTGTRARSSSSSSSSPTSGSSVSPTPASPRLLSVISAARPKIADYPFTTLSPNLGVVPLSDHRTFVVADIPGIIEGAHEGKGLGLQFLRHIERTRMLAFLIPIDSMDWQEEYDQLRTEIRSYSAELADKPHCVVFTKMDLLGERAAAHRGARCLRRVRDQRAPDGWGSTRCSTRGGASCSISEERHRCRRPTPSSPSERSRTPRSRCRSSRESAVRFRELVEYSAPPRARWMTPQCRPTSAPRERGPSAYSSRRRPWARARWGSAKRTIPNASARSATLRRCCSPSARSRSSGRRASRSSAPGEPPPTASA